jgi:hypothetical protein
MAKLKKHKSPCSDQIQAEDEKSVSAIHNLINSVWNKKELPD